MPEPADPGPEVAPRRRAVVLARRFAKEGAGTLVALATGVAALLFTLFPDLKPFTPTKLRAELSIRAVDRAVTRDQWRWEIAQGDPRRHAALLAQDHALAAFKDACGGGTDAGYVVYVKTQVEGFKRRQLRLRASLYDATTKQRAEDVEDAHAVLASVPIDAPTVVSVQRVWLYDPRAARRYVVRVELYDQHDDLLAFADSGPVDGLTRAELARLPGTCLNSG